MRHKTADGIITDDDTVFMAQVARCLNEHDPAFNAQVWHTGGGIFCINVDVPGRNVVMCWGTADTTWGADVTDIEGDVIDNILPTDVSSDSTNPEAVAEAISKAVRDYSSKSSSNSIG